MAAKTIQTKVRDIKLLAELCKEMKIDQLKLPDGTCIVMHSLAFYDTNETDLTQKPNQSTENVLANQMTLDESIDEETLFMSARA